MLLLLLFFQTFDISRIDIEGLKRFKAEDVVTTMGLKPNSKAGKAEFDAACQKLVSSGLFQDCSWKYAPTSNSAIALAFRLRETPPTQKVRINIPGSDEKAMWDWMKKNEPLVTTTMPENHDAEQFYTRAVQRFLKQDLAPSIDTNLATKENVMVFRPANAPAIESVKFAGSQAIDAATLEKTLEPFAKGTPSTDFDVKQLLDLHIRPLYENQGHLNVTFSSIETQGSAVTVTVNEGNVYKLGKVESKGASVPPKLSPGSPAIWRDVTGALDDAAKALREKGHLNAKYDVARKLNEDGTVDLNVTYTPGPQFVFGTLKLTGLNPTQEAMIRPLWTVPAGAPISEDYPNQFIKAAFQKLGPEFSGVAQQIEPREGANVVDVSITFRTR